MTSQSVGHYLNPIHSLYRCKGEDRSVNASLYRSAIDVVEVDGENITLGAGRWWDDKDILKVAE